VFLGVEGAGRASSHLAGIEVRPFPTHDVEMVAQDLFLRIVAGDQDTERIVEEGIAEQRTEGGLDATILLVVVARYEGPCLHSRLIEGPRRLDVDRRADRARGDAVVGSLVNGGLTDVFGPQ